MSQQPNTVAAMMATNCSPVLKSAAAYASRIDTPQFWPGFLFDLAALNSFASTVASSASAARHTATGYCLFVGWKSIASTAAAAKATAKSEASMIETSGFRSPPSMLSFPSRAVFTVGATVRARRIPTLVKTSVSRITIPIIIEGVRSSQPSVP